MLVAISLILVTGISNSAYAEKCKDIKYEDKALKWDSEGHGDNSPSKKDFYNDMNENTFCEQARGIDHMDYKGAIREDTKHDWAWFKTTLVYESASEDTQKKLRDLYELPDNGKMNLEAYEFLVAIYS